MNEYINVRLIAHHAKASMRFTLLPLIGSNTYRTQTQLPGENSIRLRL